ncbi:MULTISPECIES: hypothetical protein [Sinorhizobium]|uniref:hypothetical protein n=1 Tax=Sinorhizobium TaxID=28105 RepID=UPI000A5D0BCD|nr:MULTISPECIES: hypothetical protein [Sinorhizobium]WOS67089.1 hypothetical protein SFGR64A_30315 [Sinorhizobium fredii GR64]
MVNRSTHIVDGLLALRSARAAAARERAIGREVLTLPLLAARLVGGFATPAGTDVLFPAIHAALAAGGFRAIGAIARLPGTPRAVMQTLDSAWRADLDLSEAAGEAARFHDLKLIEERIREHIPSSHMLPRDLRDAAVKRVDLARALLGHVTLVGIVEVDPLWRPLLNEIARVTELFWDLPEPLRAAVVRGKGPKKTDDSPDPYIGRGER